MYYNYGSDIRSSSGNISVQAVEELIAFSLRIPRRLAKGAEAAARELGLSKSEYARRAIEELNHRVMQERIAKLSHSLAAASAAAAQAMDAASSDGLE
jgi:hypothetical protein